MFQVSAAPVGYRENAKCDACKMREAVSPERVAALAAFDCLAAN